MNQIVSTKWLFNNLNEKNIVIFDCSWNLKNNLYSERKKFKNIHIKGAYFFDIEKISSKNTKLPHMLPSVKKFKYFTRNFNIQKNTNIITYGTDDVMGASRVWWMFKFFGFNNVYVLNGCLKKWIKEKKIVSNHQTKKIQSNFNFKINSEWLTKKGEIIKNYNNKNYLIIDARNSNRYLGIEKEPRKGLRTGNIPNSKNIFWKNITNKDGSLIQRSKIIKKFKNYNFKNKIVIYTCGSGISACVLSLSFMHELNIKGSVYDGSWAEWGSQKQYY